MKIIFCAYLYIQMEDEFVLHFGLVLSFLTIILYYIQYIGGKCKVKGNPTWSCFWYVLNNANLILKLFYPHYLLYMRFFTFSRCHISQLMPEFRSNHRVPILLMTANMTSSSFLFRSTPARTFGVGLGELLQTKSMSINMVLYAANNLVLPSKLKIPWSNVLYIYMCMFLGHVPLVHLPIPYCTIPK